VAVGLVKFTTSEQRERDNIMATKKSTPPAAKPAAKPATALPVGPWPPVTAAPKSPVPDTHGKTTHGTSVEQNLQADVAHMQTEITGLVDELRAAKVSHEDTTKAPPIAKGGDSEVRPSPQSKRNAGTETGR
jgi:hypothetical protein